MANNKDNKNVIQNTLSTILWTQYFGCGRRLPRLTPTFNTLRIFSVHCPVVASALNSTRAERELIVLNYRLQIYKCETATVTTVRPKRTKLVHSDQFCRHLIMAEMTVTSVSCPLFKLISNKHTKLDCSRVQEALYK